MCPIRRPIAQFQTWLGQVLAIALVLSLLGSGHGAIAQATPLDLAKQPEVTVNVSLGSAANELKFIPAEMEFVAGKRYKLVLTNPSNTKHYFTAKDFADNIWSQKVEAGNVEIKGAIHELELKPGAIAEWVFVPIKSGTYDLHCTIPGHAEAGMIGHLSVANNPKAA